MISVLISRAVRKLNKNYFQIYRHLFLQISSAYIFRDTYLLYFDKIPITFALFSELPLNSEKRLLLFLRTAV